MVNSDAGGTARQRPHVAGVTRKDPAASELYRRADDESVDGFVGASLTEEAAGGTTG